MSPTIVLRDGRPFLALGSPGGSTIITTVLQILFNRIDLGMTIPEAIAAPRASQRNTATVTSEQAFIDAYEDLLGAVRPRPGAVRRRGSPARPRSARRPASSSGRSGLLTAVAEPERRGGGSALVVRPRVAARRTVEG